MNYLILLFTAVIFFLIVIYFKLLKIDGAIAAIVLGSIIFISGEWTWLLPLIVFFFTSSALSKSSKKLKQSFKLVNQKGSNRDAWQVFANGGIPLIIAIFNLIFPTEYNYLFYISTISAANADTWATELGVFNNSMPRMINTFKPAEKGRSGAISLIGTLAAFAGSFVIAVLTLFVIQIELHTIILIAFSGLFATFIDSFLGATIQAQFYDEKNMIQTEQEFDAYGKPNNLISGKKWFNNDLVNILAILSAPFFYLLLSFVFPF